MESSEGFNDFMWELSVDWFTRQIANNLYPLQKLTQTEDGEITLDTVTTFKSSSTKFRLNQEWDEYTLDKRNRPRTARSHWTPSPHSRAAPPSSGSTRSGTSTRWTR